MTGKMIRPAPAEIEFKDMRFLITEQPQVNDFALQSTSLKILLYCIAQLLDLRKFRKDYRFSQRLRLVLYFTYLHFIISMFQRSFEKLNICSRYSFLKKRVTFNCKSGNLITYIHEIYYVSSTKIPKQKCPIQMLTHSLFSLYQYFWINEIKFECNIYLCLSYKSASLSVSE